MQSMKMQDLNLPRLLVVVKLYSLIVDEAFRGGFGYDLV